MRKLLALAICLLVSNLVVAQGHEERQSQIDVEKYRFVVVTDENSDAISVTADVKIRFLRPVPNFNLDLVKEKEGKGMMVQEVHAVNGQDAVGLEFKHEGENLRIFLDQLPEAGEVRQFRIEYKGVPADGLIISQNRHGHRTFFGDNWPNRAHHYLPTVDHPTDKAQVEWYVLAPKGFEVIANGKFVDKEMLPNGGAMWHYHEFTPIPTKVMVFGMADFAVQDLPSVAGIPLSTWVFPEDSSLGFAHYDDAADILQTFIDSIAPYPYEKLANVQSKTRYGGMENASCIFYSEGSVDRELVPLLAHEIAHQWFGNSATEANWHHIWLSEGFATYFTNLYLEWRVGPQRLQERMEMERKKVFRFAKQAMRPVVDPSVENLNQLLNANSYEKGAWVLHMLRQEVGYAVFMRSIRKYFAAYGKGNALTKDLKGIFEAESGRDLDWFFDQWIFQAGHPELKVSWKHKPKSGSLTLDVAQTQKQMPFRCTLELAIEMENGTVQREYIALKERKQKIILSVPDKIKSIQADPDKKLLGTFELIEK